MFQELKSLQKLKGQANVWFSSSRHVFHRSVIGNKCQWVWKNSIFKVFSLYNYWLDFSRKVSIQSFQFVEKRSNYKLSFLCRHQNPKGTRYPKSLLILYYPNVQTHIYQEPQVLSSTKVSIERFTNAEEDQFWSLFNLDPYISILTVHSSHKILPKLIFYQNSNSSFPVT